MHIYNYPDNPNYGLYYFMVFGINLPWTLSCVRNYVVVPNTPGKKHIRSFFRFFFAS
jgi:hypothetical protein